MKKSNLANDLICTRSSGHRRWSSCSRLSGGNDTFVRLLKLFYEDYNLLLVCPGELIRLPKSLRASAKVSIAVNGLLYWDRFVESELAAQNALMTAMKIEDILQSFICKIVMIYGMSTLALFLLIHSIASNLYCTVSLIFTLKQLHLLLMLFKLLFFVCQLMRIVQANSFNKSGRIFYQIKYCIITIWAHFKAN